MTVIQVAPVVLRKDMVMVGIRRKRTRRISQFQRVQHCKGRYRAESTSPSPTNIKKVLPPPVGPSGPPLPPILDPTIAVYYSCFDQKLWRVEPISNLKFRSSWVSLIQMSYKS